MSPRVQEHGISGGRGQSSALASMPRIAPSSQYMPKVDVYHPLNLCRGSNDVHRGTCSYYKLLDISGAWVCADGCAQRYTLHAQERVGTKFGETF